MLRPVAKFAFRNAGGLALARRLRGQDLRILMYHRFPAGSHDALARQCGHIRKHYHPVSMAAVADWLHGGPKLPPYAVAVTVDDGYDDFREFGHPIFARYEIPVTVFLVSDFLDRKSWLWFDRVVHAFCQAKVPRASVQAPDGKVLDFDLQTDALRRTEGHRLATLAVEWSAAERRKLVDELPQMLNAIMPEQAPPEYRPLTWDAVRSLMTAGVEFGSHTKSHPILAAVEDPRELQDEIAGSKNRLESELDRPVLHFCYPNGRAQDIGAVAAKAVRQAGMRTAVTAEFGLNQSNQDAFFLKRIAVDPAHDELYFERGIAGWRN